MRPDEVRVCILRIEGTNCEEETLRAFRMCGADAEIVHMKQFEGRVPHAMRRRMDDYHIMVVPGGFSAGDYVRAGAILASRMRRTAREIESFLEEGRLLGGICNGFQVLVELGLIPGLENGRCKQPDAVLTVNSSARFECRPVHLRPARKSGGPFVSGYDTSRVYTLPVAHAEGRFLAASERILEEMEANDQIIFRYCTPDGNDIDTPYPYNPNGSARSIAGACSRDGSVVGLMPHPERAFHPWQVQVYRGEKGEVSSDGRAFFESAIEHIQRRF